MKKRLLRVFLGLVMSMMLLPSAAYANMVPRHSVNVEFTCPTGEVYYATLLAEPGSILSFNVWDGMEQTAWYHEGDEDYEIWKAFVEYEDENGYGFLQEFWNCTETNALCWNYHPPDLFKILLYFPESGEFYVSAVYERYAYDSYYTVDLRELDVKGLIARQSYDFTWETVSLAARIGATIAVELGVALFFGYRGKRVIGFFAAVNAVTQVALNVVLNIIHFKMGTLVFLLFFMLLELVVFAAEAVIYKLCLPKRTGQVILPVSYALAANVMSFVVGLGIAYWVPGMF